MRDEPTDDAPVDSRQEPSGTIPGNFPGGRVPDLYAAHGASGLEKPRARWRDELYVIIFEADTRAGQIFDIVLLIAILISIAVISFETVDSVNQRWSRELQAAEWILTLLFTAEYAARLICARKPWRYALSFFGIIDLVACMPLYITVFTSFNSQSLTIVRSIRLLRVFRVLKMMRMLREAHDLKSAIIRSRDKILVFLAVVLVAVTISGTVMYQVESIYHDASDTRVNQFSSIPESMYWAIVTMTTVGYGDIVPHTWVGKIVSALLILLGYSLIIVPTGFVSAEIQSRKTTPKDLNSRTCPHCFREGHSVDANFCDICGNRLVR